MAIVDVILRKCSSIKRVFFVDLGGTTKQDPKHIEFLLRLAEIAFVTGWNVVVSTCSGQDWKNVCDTAMADRITKSLHLLESNFETAQSKSFTDEEAEKFIWELKIDKEKLEKEIETGNNPRVLQQFINTQGSSEKYEMGMKSFNKMMRKMVNELLLAFKSKVYERSLSKCLQWLQYARHNVAIKGHNLQSYKESYLHQEKLTTYTECEGNSYKIKLHIPSVYPYLVDELKEQYTKRVSGVYELPIAQEFVFEAYFLQYKDLHSLSISAINVDNLTPRLFSFSSLTPAISQQRHAVTCLEEDHLFHLRTNHLAIDGVCVARGHDNEKYLLLLQVSLSTYKAHVSKGIAIQKCVGLLEETVHGSVSIAQYYQKVGGGDIPDDKVIYAYVSPEETISNPSDQTFLDELQVHGTRSGDSSPPKYWYGFIHSSMASVIKTIKDTI